MNANGRELVEKELTYRVVGCAMAVLNELGHGLREKTYERALCIELRHQGLAFQQQHIYPVYYRGEHIDDYIPDLEVDDRLIELLSFFISVHSRLFAVGAFDE